MVDAPRVTPLRYTEANCSGSDTTITIGPRGDTSGTQRYSPDLSLAGTTVLAVPKVEVCFGGAFPVAARPRGACSRAKQANKSGGIFISINIRVITSLLRNQVISEVAVLIQANK